MEEANVNFRNFVTVKPDVTDRDSSIYSIWKEQMVCLLDSQGLLGVVVKEEEEQQPLDDKLRRRRDMLVKGWILGSIGDHALAAVLGLKTAMDVWLKLENKFSHLTLKSASAGNQSHTSSKELVQLGDIHRTLYRAALRGDWETAEKLFQQNMELSRAVISDRSETPLHVAVGTGKANDFIKKLLKLLPDEAVALKDLNEETALHYAATVGNKEAAVMLVKRKPDLLYITNKKNRLPVQIAAIQSQKEILKYLTDVSEPHVMNSPFEGQLGIRLLMAVTASEFFDVAVDLVEKYPKMAGSYDGLSALFTIAEMTNAFPDRDSFSCCQRFIYSNIVPLESESSDSTSFSTDGDIESHTAVSSINCFNITTGVRQRLRAWFFKALQHIAPQVKDIADEKLKHEQALRLVKCLCDKMESLPHNEAMEIYAKSIICAAGSGIHEIVQAIADRSPVSVFANDKMNRNIFMIAARGRFHNVFNLIYNMSDRKFNFWDNSDKEHNNMMHLCAKIAPSYKLDILPGAALQMQRELQWFKEVEKFVHPSRRYWRNNRNKTPKMLFTEEHFKLKEEGEKWMRSTGNSCTIAAALIATVVFAAAFTVPGGLGSDSGLPVFLGRFSFVVFALSDAVSLFTSLTSLLMFLSILTSRYAEEDFLYVLPKRLCIGLVMLFVSITSMMVAFGASLYLVILEKDTWAFVVVAGLACLPVASFVRLQFPLLIDVVYSTYGPGIFGKTTSQFLY